MNTQMVDWTNSGFFSRLPRLTRSLLRPAAVVAPFLALAMPATTACAQNLIQDPSFEANAPTASIQPPWHVASGAVDIWTAGITSLTPHSGSYFANPFDNSSVLTQDVSIAKSGKYQFQFFYAATAGQTWALTAKVAGITVFTKSDITNTAMESASSVVKLNAGSAQVLFDSEFVSGATFPEFGIDDVSLIYLGPNALSFASLNRNQTAMASSINAAMDAGALTTVTNALAGASDQKELAGALNQLSPEIYNYGLVETLYGSQQFANDLMSCKVAGQQGVSIAREGQCLWVRARARFSDFDRTSEDIGAHATTGSFSAGGQIALAPDWRLGFAAGYDSVSLSSGVATSEGDRANVGGIIKYNPGQWLFAAGVTGGWSTYDTDRTMLFGDFSSAAHSKNDINYVSGQLHAGYSFQHDNYYVKPLVDAAITNVSLDGFTENDGGGAALAVAGKSDTVVSVSPGIEFGSEKNVHNFVTIRPFVRAGLTWQDTDQFLLNTNFADAPDVAGFTTATKLDTLFADVSAGVDLINMHGATLSLQYDGHYAEDTSLSSISVKGSARF
ncbi:autotransporter outer membrane beta-barrel domain-containing protein [Hyphomicrobium sp. B1]|uniref:autotransporter outer membrane beta-barrel domain-containing protein n=1 Tax=Hyphomicrobium sp. B1 TaxID=3075651 RepID=UPI003C2DBC07